MRCMQSGLLPVLLHLVIASLFNEVQGHATCNPNVAVPGTYFQTDIRIGHGCDGNSTINVTVIIPDSIAVAKPRPIAGWTISIQKDEQAKAVKSITWSNGNLSDKHYDDFGLQLKLPGGEDGTKLYFPTYQVCTQGVNEWVGTESASHDHSNHGKEQGEMKEQDPAPFITLMKNGTLPAKDGAATTKGPNSASADSASTPTSSAATTLLPSPANAGLIVVLGLVGAAQTLSLTSLA